MKVLEEKENNFHVGIRSSSFDKQAWEKFLPEFICKCAKKTREMKFWTFSIQNYSTFLVFPNSTIIEGNRQILKWLKGSLKIPT